MKISLKNKSSVIIASVAVATFLFLHYFVYLDNASGEVPILQSYTDPPVEFEELSLCEEKHPTYLNPFRKVEYSYQVNLGDDGYGECDIVERAESIFTSKMQPLSGDVSIYWGGYEQDGFERPFVDNTYANLVFFIVQYLLIAIFVFILLKPMKSE